MSTTTAPRHASSEELEAGLAHVVGMMSRPFVSSHSRVLGVRFRAGTFRAFCGIGAGELSDRHVGLSELEPRLWRIFRRVFDSGFTPARLRAVEASLIEAARHRNALDARIQHGVDIIESSHGNVSVEMASHELGMSRQHFRRRFLENVGVSPKTFARISRLDRAVSAARRAGAARALPDLADFAAAHGYADQAHLTREFTALTGRTPRRYLAESTVSA